MGLSVGIIGLPNVGKSTLLNALTQSSVEASNYPFCTIDKNLGMADVPDNNLGRLAEILAPEEAVPTSIQFIDIAGLVEGASRGEGLGNKFLGHIREVDLLLHVIRCFEDENISHAYASIDPERDAATVEQELLLADLLTAESCLERTTRAFRGGHKDRIKDLEAYTKAVEALNQGTPLRDLAFSDDELPAIKEARFLTSKSVLYLLNVSDSDPLGDSSTAKAFKIARGKETVISVAIKIEEEIAQLPEEEGRVFLQDLGIDEPGLHKVILGCYRTLQLITFYTIANNKLRAWQLQKGLTAPKAAGRVHGDMEKGFIRAEVMTLKDLMERKSRSALQENGLVQVVGKDHVVNNNEVLQFHFKA